MQRRCGFYDEKEREAEKLEPEGEPGAKGPLGFDRDGEAPRAEAAPQAELKPPKAAVVLGEALLPVLEGLGERKAKDSGKRAAKALVLFLN